MVKMVCKKAADEKSPWSLTPNLKETNEEKDIIELEQRKGQRMGLARPSERSENSYPRPF